MAREEFIRSAAWLAPVSRHIHPYFHRRAIFVKASSSRRKENRAPEPTINRFDEFYDDPRVFQRYSTRYFHASPPVRRSSRQSCYACAEQQGRNSVAERDCLSVCYGSLQRRDTCCFLFLFFLRLLRTYSWLSFIHQSRLIT